MTEHPAYHYTVSLAAMRRHVFTIELQIPSPDPAGQRLTLPAWIPGSYMIRDFARNIVQIAARTAAGAQVALTQLDKQSWQAAPIAEGPLVIDYQVYAFDTSVRAAYLDDRRAFFNGTSLFLRPVGQESSPCAVTLLEPEDLDDYWQVATTLFPVEIDAAGFGDYQASDYADLIDHPVEISSILWLPFRAQEREHVVAVPLSEVFDTIRFTSDLAKICAEHIRMFGELPEFDHYLFLLATTANDYGGLEHRASCSLVIARDDLPPSGMQTPTDGYIRLLGLCSHEYFHLWNVKRITPERFARSDLSQEAHSTLLWFFEGVTSYYDDLALVRAGCISPEDYMTLLAQSISRLNRTTGHRQQSLAASSFDAWTKFYKQDENAPNAIVSYYGKGSLVAFGLDMKIRRASADRLSLDDLMRAVWATYGRTHTPVPEHGIEAIAEQLCGADALGSFFADFVHDTRELPLDDWLAAVGIEARYRAARKPDDLGGYVSGWPEEEPAQVSLGISTAAGRDGLLQIRQVLDDGVGQRVGLAPRDLLVAWNGLRITADGLPKLLARAQVGDSVTLHVFRNDQLLTYPLVLPAAPRSICDLRLLDAAEAPAPAMARRNAWLHRTAE